ncbi:MAG: hypothetical protein PQJ60_02820 [Spirochaetales bacterium]|nr:hypothetical protein [Spirochaetales bacterium]
MVLGFNNIKGWFFILFVWGAFFTVLGAEEIESIRISGLKRSKEETVLTIVDVSPGDEVVPGLETLVEQRLRKSGLFQEDISVALTPGSEGMILDITVYDRWTLLGIPYVSSSSGDVSGGIVVLESNLAGTGNFLLSTVLLSSDGDAQAFLLYRDSTAFGTDYSGRGSLIGGVASESNTSLDEEEVWEDYSTSSLQLGLGAGKDFSDELSLILIGRGGFWENRERDLTPPDAGEGHVDLTLEGQAKYDGRTLYPLFSKGWEGTLEGAVHWEPASGGTTLLLEGKAARAWAVDSKLQVKLTLKGGVTDDDFHYLFRLGGSTGSLTLPSDNIATDLYGNGELKGEFLLVKIGSAYITIPLFGEAGYLVDYQEEEQTYWGVGGGFRLYVDKVALPAMGLDYRYNFTTEVGGVSFFIGVSY